MTREEIVDECLAQSASRAALRRAPWELERLGLAQACARWACAPAESDEAAIYRALQRWLCRASDEAPYARAHDLLKALTQRRRASYLVACAQARDLLWCLSQATERSDA